MTCTLRKLRPQAGVGAELVPIMLIADRRENTSPQVMYSASNLICRPTKLRYLALGLVFVNKLKRPYQHQIRIRINKLCILKG